MGPVESPVLNADSNAMRDLYVGRTFKLGLKLKLVAYHKRLWVERYKDFCQFYTANGHSHVPRENRQLQSWVGMQKKAYKNGTMSLEHKKLMEEIDDFGGEDEMNAVVRGILDKHIGRLL